MATIKDLAEQYGLEDYQQLLGGYPNAEKFITGLKDAAVRSVPTTEQMRDPNFIIDTAGLGGAIKALKLHHGSDRIVPKVERQGLFDAIFATPDRDAALSHGDKISNYYVNESKIGHDFGDKYDDAMTLLRHHYPNASDDDIENILYPAIAEDVTPWNMNHEEVMRVTGVPDMSEASWKLQADRGKIGKALGYDAVKVRDEHGDSYMIPFGSKAKYRAGSLDELANKYNEMHPDKNQVSWDITSDPHFDEEGYEMPGDPYVLIEKVYTHPDDRNKGVATRLMSDAMREIESKHPNMPIKLSPIPLDKDTDIERLADFYRKFGFDEMPEGHMQKYAEGGAVDSAISDYKQLLSGYPNATKFANALQSNIESHIPTTEDLQSPERMGEWSLAAALNQPTGLAIKGYHGSPHKFKEFDTAHMGSGEGGQAYGWGNYITEDPYVATTYSPQDEWMDEQLMNLYNQAERRQDYPSMEVYERYMMHERPNEVKDYLKESYADYPEDLPKRLPAQKIGENLYKKQKGSHLYEVSMEFPREREAVDPMSIEHFLDYDKPLSEQSDYVRNILQSHDPDIYHPEGSDYDPSEKGSSILSRFGSGKEGAQKLYELGIPGTTYMGEKAKVANPEGVRNFVTYSDEVPRVVTRNMNKVKPLTDEDRLNDLEKQMSAYMKTKRMPKGVDFKTGSDWYDWAYDKRAKLRGYAQGGEVKALHDKYAEGGSVNTTPISYGFEYDQMANSLGLNNINYGGLNSGSTKTTTDTPKTIDTTPVTSGLSALTDMPIEKASTTVDTPADATPKYKSPYYHAEFNPTGNLVYTTRPGTNPGIPDAIDRIGRDKDGNWHDYGTEGLVMYGDTPMTSRQNIEFILKDAQQKADDTLATQRAMVVVNAMPFNPYHQSWNDTMADPLKDPNNPAYQARQNVLDWQKHLDTLEPYKPFTPQQYAKGGSVKDLHNKYEESDYGYGNRPDKTKKGLGYFGELERPDGTGVMTEYSIGVPINGKEMDVPTLVPTLTPDEIRLILHMQEGEDMPRSIVHKAIDHAHQRLSEGKPIFATEEDLYAHGGIVDVLHNDAIEQIMKAFMDSMADDEEPSAPAVSIEITTQNTETPQRGKIPKSIAREAKHG